MDDEEEDEIEVVQVDCSDDEDEDEVSHQTQTVIGGELTWNPKELDEHQSAGIPALARAKQDSTRDFLTIFTIKVRVTFKKSGKQAKDEHLNGRWCQVCK